MTRILCLLAAAATAAHAFSNTAPLLVWSSYKCVHFFKTSSSRPYWELGLVRLTPYQLLQLKHPLFSTHSSQPMIFATTML